LSRPITQRYRRTYFNSPLIEESLRFLPNALEHPTSVGFRAFLADHLPQNSLNTRRRNGEYIAHRFSHDGQMNLALALALKRYGDSRIGREILYFELLLSVPLLQEAASLWLAEQPGAGAPRVSLVSFISSRAAGRSGKQIATAALTAFRQCGKATTEKDGRVLPVWGAPATEAFLYVLTRLYPERDMVRSDAFAGLPVIRGMLWPRAAVDEALKLALDAGHLSKISELDQYRQFTLEGTGEERLGRLLGERVPPSGAKKAPDTIPAAPIEAGQLDLPLDSKR
jgi:hypothetical protein